MIVKKMCAGLNKDFRGLSLNETKNKSKPLFGYRYPVEYYDEFIDSIRTIYFQAYNCKQRNFMPNDIYSYSNDIKQFCTSIYIENTNLFSDCDLQKLYEYLMNEKKNIVHSIFVSVFENRVIPHGHHSHHPLYGPYDSTGTIFVDKNDNRYVFYLFAYLFINIRESTGLGSIGCYYNKYYDNNYNKKIAGDKIVVSCPNAISVPGGKRYLDNAAEPYMNYILDIFSKNQLINYYKRDTEYDSDYRYEGHLIGSWIPVL